MVHIVQVPALLAPESPEIAGSGHLFLRMRPSELLNGVRISPPNIVETDQTNFVALGPDADIPTPVHVSLALQFHVRFRMLVPDPQILQEQTMRISAPMSAAFAVVVAGLAGQSQ